jgi:hypothetical protein
MDFAFTTAPERVNASMCRPLAWQAQRLGHGVHALRLRFESGLWSASMEDPEAEFPADPFVYGHTGAVLAVSQGAVPGWSTLWDPLQYDRELWIEKLGAGMWNPRAKILPLEQALAQWSRGRMHLCPSGADSGPKAFKGFCCDREDLNFELGRAAKGVRLDPRMRVALSEPNEPDQEWRCALIDGRLVASGRYMLQGRLAETRGAPPEVEAFAREVAAAWLPGSCCVVDVGQGADGRLGVVEFNDAHASGFYALDREAIVRALAEFWPSRPRPKHKAAP